MSRTRLSIAFRPILAGALLTAAATAATGCSGGPPGPVEGHPRLFFTEQEVERLRSWAKPSNTFYENGIGKVAREYRDMMDQNKLILDANCRADDGFLPCEWFMEVFAFMSLVAPDATEREDYAQRAKKILMSMIETSLPGPSEGGGELLDPSFSTGDRSRGAGRAFGLTVDWIYPYLEGGDKEKIRKVFLRWCDENVNAHTTTDNHPEPIGVFNDPVLLQDKTAVRFSGNNYFTGHGRNLGFMAMSMDPDDDENGELHAYLDNSTGAFLYMTDTLLRGDSEGGLLPEGSEYSPLTMSYTIDLLYALHSAGLDDPSSRGPQVSIEGHPFWEAAPEAYIHSLAPGTHPLDYPGPYPDFASYGDMEIYEPYSGVHNDPIESFAPLGILARDGGDTALYDKIRWIEYNLPPGGNTTDQIAARSNSLYAPHNSLFYFLLMDPASTGQGVDPRPSMSLDYYAPGLRFLFARTGWGQEDSYFTYQLTWTGIDHRHADANNFGLYRKGEWLTKEHAGYGAYQSEVHNTVSIENDKPSHDDSLSNSIWQTGSQHTYGAQGDGTVLARSVTDTFAYALGDATDIYNSDSSNTHDVTHASRSILWLKPEHVVIYDRAATKTDGRFKRFHLQVPDSVSVDGNQAVATTVGGQQLFLTKLLPEGASLSTDTPSVEYPAGGEPMKKRLYVESKDLSARFLHVLQGADGGTAADTPVLVNSAGATAFVGAVVKSTLVAFPVDITTAFDGLEMTVPDSTKTFLITGLLPLGSYDVTVDPPDDGAIHLTVKPGSGQKADEGGVLAF